MPSVASFAVKKDDVVHAQANDTIKRCVEMLVVKGGLLNIKSYLKCVLCFVSWTQKSRN